MKKISRLIILFAIFPVITTCCEEVFDLGITWNELEGEWETISFEYDSIYSNCQEIEMSDDSLIQNSDFHLIYLIIGQPEGAVPHLIMRDNCNDALEHQANTASGGFLGIKHHDGKDMIIYSHYFLGTLLRLSIIDYQNKLLPWLCFLLRNVIYTVSNNEYID